jgi:DNA-binding beta-propeller fold protein YncE
MTRKAIVRFVVLAALVVAAAAHREIAGIAQRAGADGSMPVFEVDTAWPVVPNNWVIGNVSSVAVDSRDHAWVLQRPKSVPEAMRNRAAPPVLEFDANGKFVQGWGGEGEGYDWPDQPHGIAVDHKNNVWITGAAYATIPAIRSDDMTLKFTNKGKFLLQIGGRTVNKGNADTKTLNRPADVVVLAKTNEAFFADGYGNRRVIVLNADTGAFKRMWGAFGNKPEDGRQGLFGGGPVAGTPAPPPAATPAPGGGRGPSGAELQISVVDTEGNGLPQFSNPVHAIKISNDGLVYVADRVGRRVQVFTTDGKYVTQGFVNRSGPSRESAAGLAFSPDAQQRFLYVGDFGNSRIVVMNRKTLEVLYQFGTRNASPGNFQGVHHIAADSKGNLYTAEVNPGNRAQRFVFKGLSATPPPNALPTTKPSEGR